MLIKGGPGNLLKDVVISTKFVDEYPINELKLYKLICVLQSYKCALLQNEVAVA